MGDAGILGVELSDHVGQRQELLPRDHLITLALSFLTVGGMYVDTVAHNVRPSDTFFSPWHLIIYSGFLSLFVWLWSCTGRIRQGGDLRRAIPAGYDLAIAGAALVLVSGVLDAVWHTLAGPEVGVEVLVSPTHAVLLLGTVLIVLSPFRAAWVGSTPTGTRISFQAFLPALLSIILGMMVLALAFMYIWPFFPDPLRARVTLIEILDMRGPPGRLIANALWQVTVRGVSSSILLSNFIILAPILMMAKRWECRSGAFRSFYFHHGRILQVDPRGDRRRARGWRVGASPPPGAQPHRVQALCHAVSPGVVELLFGCDISDLAIELVSARNCGVGGVDRRRRAGPQHRDDVRSNARRGHCCRSTRVRVA